MSAADLKTMLARAVAESDGQMEIVGPTVRDRPDAAQASLARH
jgi:hypothetical protein